MGDLFTEIQYVPFISYRLEKFKRVGRNRWQFRCPLCGDSKKSTRKTRGTIYEKEGKLLFGCFNCGESHSFIDFLQLIDPAVYRQLLTEIYSSEKQNFDEAWGWGSDKDFEDLTFPVFKVSNKKKPEVVHQVITPITSLKPFHAAIKYLQERLIPEEAWCNLYFTTKFDEFCGEKQFKQEPRIVLPCYDLMNNLFAAQGRILPDYNGVRYKLYRIMGELPIIFGLERLDKEQHVYVVEGPIDSLFLPNSLAICSAHLYRIHDMLSEHGIEVELPSITLVFDNERRNPDLLNMMEKAIERGFNVCIWPELLEEKDINAMALAGIEALPIIQENTYQGIQADMKLASWRRCGPKKFTPRREKRDTGFVL